MNIKNAVAVTAVSLVAILGLAGCSDGVSAEPDPKATAAVTEVEASAEPVEVEVQEPPAVNSFIKPFGEVVTYDSGVSVSLGQPVAYTPGEYSQGAVEGQTPMVFKVVLTNNSDQPIDPYAFVSVSSAGAEAGVIGDIMHPEYGDIGLSPTTKVLPGQPVEWYVAYSVADPAAITADVQVASELESAVFTNIAF